MGLATVAQGAVGAETPFGLSPTVPASGERLDFTIVKVELESLVFWAVAKVLDLLKELDQMTAASSDT